MKHIIPLFGLALTMMTSLAHGASSDWFETDGARLRLIALPSSDGSKLDAGLQIELEPGWKTYWRSPGASGLPPQIDLSASSNVGSTKIEFPVPTVFGEGTNLTAGYTSTVTLPITISPLFADRPVDLKATGVVGICAEICVPVPFLLALPNAANGSSSRDVASALFSARANTMKTASENFRIESVVLDNESGRKLKVAALVPEGTIASVLFVEGPSDWYLLPVSASSIEGNEAFFEVNLTDIPADADPKATSLTVSLTADGAGVEQTITPK